MSDRISKRVRQRVIERAHGCCEYCLSQEHLSPSSFSLEHIVPRQMGGTSTEDNLALSCQECNNHKYTKIEAPDPLTAASVPIYHPRHHDWQEHFTWSDDTTLLIGLSAIGRATIELLQLNRPHLINLRQLLSSVGRHPPDHSKQRNDIG